MTTACLKRRVPRYRGLFPDWTGKRPFDFYLLENLLEARRESFFPTNGAGPDEDVNVYLAGLLARRLDGFCPGLRPGAEPVLTPPPAGLPRATAADRYRREADHRLFCQGIFGRGEMIRRRRTPFGMTAGEAAARDRNVGAACYEAAARLLGRGPQAPAGLIAVLGKLADRWDDWVHVLGALATRRLGLGARLSDGDLTVLTLPPAEGATAPSADPDPAALALPDMDVLLDLVSEYRRTGEIGARDRALAAAAALGVDPDRLPTLNISRD